MRIAITGASGLIGSALNRRLEASGHETVALVRGGSRPGIRWDPKGGTVDSERLGGVDAIVHLAGENVGGGRWTEDRKRRIHDSREQGTRTLVKGIEAASPRPKVLVSASAIGFYGDRGDARLDESAEPGDGFLAGVCEVWEREAQKAAELGLRVVRVRIGVVLASEGGALAKMKLPFQMGLGGRIGDGRQFMSWVHLEDVVSVFERALEDESMQGAYNAVAPEPVRNARFTKALGKALHRPTVIPVPKFAVKAMLGSDGADEMLLASTRAVPKRLEQTDFTWRFGDLDAALADVV